MRSHMEAYLRSAPKHPNTHPYMQDLALEFEQLLAKHALAPDKGSFQNLRNLLRRPRRVLRLRIQAPLLLDAEASFL